MSLTIRSLIQLSAFLLCITAIAPVFSSPNLDNYPIYPLQSQATFQASESSPLKPMRVAYLPPATEFNYYLDIAKGIAEEAKQHNIDTFLLAPQLDNPKQQLAMLQRVISEQVDAIILSTHDEELLAPAIEDAIDKGIVVIIVNSDTRKFAVPVHAIVGYPQRKGTFELGRYAATRLSRETTLVGIIEGEPGYHSQERVLGFEQAIKDTFLHVATKKNGHWNTEGGFAATLALLKTEPEIGLIFATNDFEILGAAAALATLGREDVILLGNDGVQDALTAINNNRLQATVYTNPKLMGRIALQASLNIRAGYFNGGYIETSIDIVDKTNIHDFISPPPDLEKSHSTSRLRIYAEPIKGLTSEDGSGLYWDLFRLIYEPEGIQVITVSVPLKRAHATIRAARADIMLGHNRSDATGVFFPQWHYASQSVVAVYLDIEEPWAGQKSLTHKRVAWVRGEDYGKYLSVPISHEAQGNYLSPLRMLSRDRIDFFLGDAELIEKTFTASQDIIESGNVTIDEYTIKHLFELKLYPAFTDTPRGHKLAEIFDRKIPQLRASGELKALYMEWGKDDISFSPLESNTTTR